MVLKQLCRLERCEKIEIKEEVPDKGNHLHIMINYQLGFKIINYNIDAVNLVEVIYSFFCCRLRMGSMVKLDIMQCFMWRRDSIKDAFD